MNTLRSCEYIGAAGVHVPLSCPNKRIQRDAEDFKYLYSRRDLWQSPRSHLATSASATHLRKKLAPYIGALYLIECSSEVSP